MWHKEGIYDMSHYSIFNSIEIRELSDRGQLYPGEEWEVATYFHYFIESQTSIDKLNRQQNPKIRIVSDCNLNNSSNPDHDWHWRPELLKKKEPFWCLFVLQFIFAVNL